MKLTSDIIKNISKDKDKLCQVFLGRIWDEDENKYAEIYKDEIGTFLERLEENFNILEENNINITNDILKSYIISEWNCGLDWYDVKKLDKYIDDLLEMSKRESTQALDFNITKKEKEFIRGLLDAEANKNRDMLLNLIYNKDYDMSKLLLHFKETYINHYNHLINTMKNEYITSVNLLYKMFNKQPKDWSTGLSLHNAVCRDFNINREEFLF